MDNNLQTWNYENSEIRTVEKDGEPWWVLADVCKVLELTTPSRVAERLEKDEVSQTHTIDRMGRTQKSTIINESGLYAVILRSDKPQAKPFRKWVTNEVLPSIRKHGAYMTDQTLEQALTSPDFLIQLATQLKEEKEQRKQLEVKVEQDRPKVLFAESVSASKTSILVGELAKILKQNGVDTGQTRLFAWMRENGYLIKRRGNDYNMPTQRAMEMKLFEVKETSVTHSDGHISVNKTPKVTGKGQVYFVNKIMAKRNRQA
ncbi:phage antirepressor [Ruminococcus sp.]|uniref:phage antirepressor n=1 Tax=Ruminococcus sp. TaxID=41978 RepID=UPI0039A061D0